MKTEIEPLLYGSKPMNPAPINIGMPELAQRLRQGEPMIAELEPGDGTYYNLLIVPAWADGVERHLGRFGIRANNAHNYLMVTHLRSDYGELFYVTQPVEEVDVANVKHPWTRNVFYWWLNLLWNEIREPRGQ